MISDRFRDPTSLPPPLRFLAGGGEATRLILERDWSHHPLGPPERWPEGLKTVLSTVLNSPESMIVLWGREALTFFFNETYFPLLGPRLAWAMGAPFREVWADAVAQAMPIIEDAFAGRSQRFTDLPWKLDTDRGPADTWFTFSYSRILDTNGDIAGLFIFTNETTARVLADAALRASQEQLRRETERQRLSLQQMPGFVALLAGPTHVYEYVNDAYVAISGPRQFVGRTVREVFPELASQGFYELLDEVYTTGRPFSGRALPIHLAGEDTPRSIDLLYQPLRSDGGQVVGIFVGGYDVTERMRAEQALARANSTLEQRIAQALHEREQVEAALRQAQKMEAVGQLTGGIAHDFNNMLTGVIGPLDLLQFHLAKGNMDRVPKYIDAARTSAQRAAGLTQRLLAFSRRQSLDVKPVDVNTLVKGMEELLRRTLGENIGLELVRRADLWPAMTDSNQLESALLNLTINARDAMPDGGLLTVETANTRLDEAFVKNVDGLRAGDYVVTSVTDTGTGMSEEVLAKAFEPFFTTKPIGSGTGLGLSMIYGFARQSGGHVRIDSEVGRGTTIQLYLPRHRGAVADARKEAIEVHPAQSGEQVLLVEDDPTVRMLVDDVLSDLGYGVRQAADGREALPLLEEMGRIDLLITDVGLPGMNGRQLAEIARQKRPGIKVLFITGYAERAAVRGEFLAEGMEMITKPFAIDVLSAKVREMIESR